MTRRPNHRRAPLSLHARRARSWFWTWVTVNVLGFAFMLPLLWIWWSVSYADGETIANAAMLFLWLAAAQVVMPLIGLVGVVSFTATLYHVVMK